MTRGRYIVLEGTEGVGKTTQIELLALKLKRAGWPVRQLREPDSQSDLTARAIRQLTQDPRYPMNTRTEVLLYNAARSQSLAVIRESVKNGVICLVDRNYLTTLAIQYYGRGDVPDYQTITSIIDFAVDGIEPDLTIILDAPVAMLRERASSRGKGERFDNLGEDFLERVRSGYLWEAKQRNLPVVFATEKPEKVAEGIWQLVSESLEKPEAETAALEAPTAIGELIQKRQTVSRPPETTTTDSIELLKKDSAGASHITQAGHDFLDKAITNSRSNVYAFKAGFSQLTAAAAMARLSRRADDMRVTILDEFSQGADKDSELLKRVITAFGDDSVQQLVGIHIVVEGASNLLTKKLEWGRLAAYLEQSTRYIYFDQKDNDGNFKYVVPATLNKKTASAYQAGMDEIFSSYSLLVRKLTEYVQKLSKTSVAEQDGAWRSATRAQACDAARAVLPVATRSTVGIFASGQALENLIMQLQADEFDEARQVGQQILEEARQVIPAFLERADKPERGGALIAYRATTKSKVAELGAKFLKSQPPAKQPELELTDYWPRNELDLVADMLYESSDLPLETIRDEVAGWDYKKKEQLFKTYIGERLNRRHRPGRALEKAHYSWDIVCDYGIFRDLQRHRMVDDLAWQKLSAGHGYEIPELVYDAGLSELAERCFNISAALQKRLVEDGFGNEAQYATLLGHKMRWKLTYNAREAFHLHELRTTPQGHPGYRKLVQQMHQKLSDIHPLIGDAMRFVNQDEDPELTRLAAERYAQFKLAKFGGANTKN